jgi:indolepyruvate ferredoxin oxidoreductase
VLAPRPTPAILLEAPPEPELPQLADDFRILMIGVGSTGVVTVNALLATAARRAGLWASQLDQTGLSQRGGRVASHCRIARSALAGTAQVPAHGADLLLAFDALGASDSRSLACLDPDRSACMLHENVAPTADAVSDIRRALPSLEFLARRIAPHTRSLDRLPAEELCTALLGSPRPANVMLLGAAYQRGLLPLPADALEGAILEHGLATDTNLRAFRLGRSFAVHPEEIAKVLRSSAPVGIGDGIAPEHAATLLGQIWRELDSLVGHLRVEDDRIVDPRSLSRQLAHFAVDLCDFQNRAYGARYVRTLLPLARAELACVPHGADSLRVLPSAARELYRLMAYKDEYEVARLHLRGPFRRWLEERTGPGLRPSYLLHPPALRALGLKRKLALRFGAEGILRLLAALRWLRATPFDPFGRSEVRRSERELVRWYEGVLGQLAERMESLGIRRAREVAETAAQVRGYEGIKLANAASAREQAEKLLCEVDPERTTAGG